MLLGLATAHLLLGNYSEGLGWSKKLYFEVGEPVPPALWTLAACAAYCGERALCDEAIQRLRRRKLEWTLGNVQTYYKVQLRWRRQQDIDRMIEGLRLAGFPE